MEDRVFVLQVSEANGPWAPQVFANRNDAINTGVSILVEWFPDEWQPRRIEVAKQTLKNTSGFVFVSESNQTIKLKIFSCGVQKSA